MSHSIMTTTTIRATRPNHALQRSLYRRSKPSRAGGNGFARARALSPAGLLAMLEFLSPAPSRLKCGVPWAGSLSLGR